MLAHQVSVVTEDSWASLVWYAGSLTKTSPYSTNVLYNYLMITKIDNLFCKIVIKCMKFNAQLDGIG